MPVLLVFLTASCGATAQMHAPAGKDILDLSRHDFSSHPVVTLAGNWDFMPVLLDGNVTEVVAEKEWSSIKVPGAWPEDAVAPGFDYPFGVGT